MFVVTGVLQLFVPPYVAGWPLAVRLLLSATVVVILLGHVLMPALTRILRGWLDPRR